MSIGFNTVVVKKFEDLYTRWEGSDEYEDFEDYIAAMKAVLPPGCEFQGMTHSPVFCLMWSEAEEHFALRVRGNLVTLQTKRRT